MNRSPSGWRWNLVLLISFLAGSTGFGAEASAPSEYQVKAALVFNLTKYVEWPPECFSTTNSPLVLGILGEDNFGDDFKRMIEEKTIHGRKLLLKRVNWGDEVHKVHLLFISASEKKRLPDILGRLKGVPVLTVGETDTFIPLGGMIRLSRKENRIRPEVNLAAVERAHLKISSKLL